MSRFFRASIVLILLVLGSCSSRNYSAPSNLGDACSIVRDFPHYLRAMQATERKWKVPVHVQMAIIYQESKFIGNARPPLQSTGRGFSKKRASSAYGYSQALDGTWDDYRESTGNWSGKRNNIYDASDFIGWYMAETKRRNGVSLSNARNQYLAYHEGQGGYSRGTYKSKTWLIRVADTVTSRAATYKRQLRSCS